MMFSVMPDIILMKIIRSMLKIMAIFLCNKIVNIHYYVIVIKLFPCTVIVIDISKGTVIVTRNWWRESFQKRTQETQTAIRWNIFTGAPWQNNRMITNNSINCSTKCHFYFKQVKKKSFYIIQSSLFNSNS